MLKQYPGKRLRDPKQCCKMLQGTSRRDASLDSASFFCEDPYIEDRVQDLPDRFSVEAAGQDPFVRQSAICTRSV